MTESLFPQPDGLLFDLDGVIADVGESYRRCIIRTAEELGCFVSESDVNAAKQRGRANNDWELTEKLLLERGLWAEPGEITRIFQSWYLGYGGRPGLRERERLLVKRPLLQKLTHRFPSAIVTGRPAEEALWFLKRFQIESLFRVVITMEDAEPKPSPACVILATERLGITKPWMLGDTTDDMRAALDAGAVPVGVISGADEAEDRRALTAAGARFVISDINDIQRYLR